MNAPRHDLRPPRSRSPWLAGLSLVVFAAVGAALVGYVADSTRDRIAENEARQIMKLLDQMLPAGGYDNEPHLDRIAIRDPDLLGSDAEQTVYRARLGGRPVAAIIEIEAPNGYVGPISLLVGVLPDGTITGVRVVGHRETPGLGDRIELDKSDWILAFDGRSLGAPPVTGWAVRTDGGDFDHITAATVTSRAVIAAVRDALLYVETNPERLFAPQ